MYQLYKKGEAGFDSRKLLLEDNDIDKIYEVVDAEVAKDKDFKYIIEESTGKVNAYGDLIIDVYDEN